MPIKPFIILLLLGITFSACSKKTGYQFWEISKFTINDSALRDGEPIKLLYASRGPDYNKNREYYYHVIVISQETGDTVNILTTIMNGFKPESNKQVYNYISPNNQFYPFLDENNNEAGNNNKTITKVARDPEFDYIADNNFPTVIGMIGSTKLDISQ